MVDVPEKSQQDIEDEAFERWFWKKYEDTKELSTDEFLYEWADDIDKTLFPKKKECEE